MAVLRDVLVQGVHELPAVLVAEGREPAIDGKERRARGQRARHGDVALVFGLGEIFPRLGRGDAQLLAFYRVVADRRGPCVDADPDRVFAVVAHHRADGAVVGRLVAFEQAQRIGGHQGRNGIAHDHVGLRIGGFCDDAGDDGRSRAIDHLDLHVRIGCHEAVDERLGLIFIERAVDGQVRCSASAEEPPIMVARSVATAKRREMVAIMRYPLVCWWPR